MRSPVGWALLGLVIERPGSGHDFLKRFQRVYGGALELSSTSQIYIALDSLVRRELVEELRGDSGPPDVEDSDGARSDGDDNGERSGGEDSEREDAGTLDGRPSSTGRSGPVGSVERSLDTLAGARSAAGAIGEGFSSAAPAEEPKSTYRATQKGVRAYQDWLVSQAREERRRSRLFTLQVAALTPEAALQVIESYELACLEHANDRPSRLHMGGQDARERLAARLAGEEDRLAVGARLAWIEYARRELKALAARRAEADI